MHGLTVPSQIFHDAGYVEALRGQYRVVLLDFRGHGQSEKPGDATAYRWNLLAGDVIAGLDALDLETVHAWGYSFGARIGYQLAGSFPGRFRSLILGGSHPIADPEFIRTLETHLTAYIDTLESEQSTDVAPFRAALEATLTGPGLEDALPTISTPILAYAGDNDPFTGHWAKLAACAIPSASFMSVGQLDHGGAAADLNRIMPIALVFLERVEADLLGDNAKEPGS